IDQTVAVVGQVSTLGLMFAGVKLLSAAHSEGRAAFVSAYVALVRILGAAALVGTGAGLMLLLARPDLLAPELNQSGVAVILALLAVPATNLGSLVSNTLASAQ